MSAMADIDLDLTFPTIGEDIYGLAAELFPICRSITGNGVRETLKVLSRHLPLDVQEVPTGTQVLDWAIPQEWNIHDAYIKNSAGERVVDFRRNNLHVLNYSTPVNANLPLSELKKHIFTLPDQSDLIPYRTSYYKEQWGFCHTHNAVNALPDGNYDVCIDSSLKDGSLTYGEYVHKGKTDDECLIAAHICHPSLANDNCSGLAVLTLLAKRLRHRNTKLSYRFLFAPGTIGAIAWLARNETHVGHIKHGLTVSCLGDGAGPTYKKSRQGNAEIDRAMAHIINHTSPSATVIDFSPYGYDERQYCSPGFNLPVGLLQRSQHGTFPEYHTSADNLDFIKPAHLAESYNIIADVIDLLENNTRYINTSPKGEPQLGRRGLYNAVGGDKNSAMHNMAMLWVLNLSDGDHSLLDIAERANLSFKHILKAAKLLQANDLVIPAS